MKIVQVNTVSGTGSVGRICVDLYEILKAGGHEPYIATGRGTLSSEIKGFKIGNNWDFYSHVIKNFVSGKSGFGSRRVTEKFIEWLREIKPDIIHLHNIHGFYLQTELFFSYLKETDVSVVWTLHDCWPFTGHCAYFDFTGCDKWRQEGGCHDCKVHRKVYPYALLKDNTRWNYKVKKKAYTGVKNLTIVTPSYWLLGLVKSSFLGEYPVEVIPNGINLNVFCPPEESAQTREGNYIVLGVANRWEERKGLAYFIKLAEELPSHYEIHLVGLNKSQVKKINSLNAKRKGAGIVPIPRTDTVETLAKCYAGADVYVNATLEDNFPTTNVEALACGTPVITFETGGSPESLTKDCGIVVPKGDLKELTKAVRYVCEEKPFNGENCRKRAMEYDRQDRYMQYISLYEKVLKGQNQAK